MLLPADMFEEMVSTLASRATAVAARAAAPSGAAPVRQRRAMPRVPVASRLTLVPFAPGAERFGGYDFPRDRLGLLKMPLGETQSVPVRDLSRGGIRFLMPRRVPLDTPFVLLLPAVLESASPVAVECSVTYWQPIQRELFAIGAQFNRILEGFATPAQSPTVVLPHLDIASGLLSLRAAV